MKVKNIIVSLALILPNILLAQQHLPESKSLVGLWRQTLFVKGDNVEKTQIKTGNYKVINPDGTFYTFIIWGAGNTNPVKDITTIGLYGTYKITSDSTYTEHIVKHSIIPSMNNTDSQLKHKRIDDKFM